MRERATNTPREQKAVDAVLAELPDLADQLQRLALTLTQAWGGHPLPSLPVARLSILVGIAATVLDECAQAARQPRGHYDELLRRTYGELYPLRS